MMQQVWLLLKKAAMLDCSSIVPGAGRITRSGMAQGHYSTPAIPIKPPRNLAMLLCAGSGSPGLVDMGGART